MVINADATSLGMKEKIWPKNVIRRNYFRSMFQRDTLHQFCQSGKKKSRIETLENHTKKKYVSQGLI